jgi:isochorismate synthase EntC
MPHLSPERIGKFEMRVTCCALAGSSAVSPERRVEALAAWLLAQWRAEHQEDEHVERDE